jgi:hypothetical protein
MGRIVMPEPSRVERRGTWRRQRPPCREVGYVDMRHMVTPEPSRAGRWGLVP